MLHTVRLKIDTSSELSQGFFKSISFPTEKKKKKKKKKKYK
jgi:hypothetical protein